MMYMVNLLGLILVNIPAKSNGKSAHIWTNILVVFTSYNCQDSPLEIKDVSFRGYDP